MSHVVLGTGPAGSAIARALVEAGEDVRAVNRSGARSPLLPEQVEIIAADAQDPATVVAACAGASVVYQALNPPYSNAAWESEFPKLQAAAVAGASSADALLVSIENLYMYDSSEPISTSSAIVPRSGKGRLRARMAEELVEMHDAGRLRVAMLRSSDYYGPGVTGSALGAMVFARLLDGKKAQLTGSADQLHSFAYIDDVGRSAAVLGTHPDAAGSTWITPHAPACTQAEMVKAICDAMGIPVRYSTLSGLMVRIGGLFVPEARAAIEMMYEFTEPFVVDDGGMREAFGITATPIDEGIAKTVAWYQQSRVLT